MAVMRVSCPVAHTLVTRVTDLEGNTTQLICPEYVEATGVCQLKTRSLDGGPLSQLLNRLDERTLDRRTTRCDLR